MNLTLDAINHAATELLSRRRSGQPGWLLADSCRPVDVDSALAIQLAVSQRQGPTQGWKCGLPKTEGPVLAPIHEVFEGLNRCRIAAPDQQVWLEPEIGFRLGQDLPAQAKPYRISDIDAAIGSRHLALELLQPRYLTAAQPGFIDSLADSLLNQALWIGPEIAANAELSSFELRVQTPGFELTRQVQHPTGSALTPVYWLVEFLRSRGQNLYRGQYLITGSYAGLLKLPLDQRIRLEFGDLASAEVEFSAR